MYPKPITKTVTFSDGRIMTIETGKLARQADGSVVVSMGDTMLLATAVAKLDAEENTNFLPLHVEYQEKFAAAGKIPGGFLRREGKLGDHEILVSRLVDRAIRPVFPAEYNVEIQVTITLISVGLDVLPDALAATAASAALMVSPIPFQHPIAEVRVVRLGGKFIVNPTQSELEQADIDLIVGGNQKHIIMVEGEMQEAQEADLLAAIEFAHEAIKLQCEVQEALAKEVGIEKVPLPEKKLEDIALQERVSQTLYPELYAIAKKGITNKKQRKESFKAAKNNYLQQLLAEDPELNTKLCEKYFYELEKQAVRDLALNEGLRLDGRKLNEIRHIWSEVNYLPAVHGSALFSRGETQSLTTVTLGNKLGEQLIDSVLLNGFNRFMLHYNFPGFSTGEVKINRGPARREIGHGNLAMRALKKVLPRDEENPYTIRVVSDILESNGSSSMATVCAGSLALMDAGVPIRTGVAGIAMGLVLQPETSKYAILSDILGDEDALGDMDFKVAGTQYGITACQMDIKVGGLSMPILEKALLQAKEGRLHILGEMNQVIREANPTYKPHAPKFSTLTIPKTMIGAVIGPGGKVIQEIQKDTKATLIVEELDGKGVVKFFAPNEEALKQAEQRVHALVAEPVIGEIYQGKVKSILPFGAFVEFMPNKDGLLHISEVKWERVENLEQVLEVGEVIAVKLVDIDPKTGKYRLSRKSLLPNPNNITISDN
jgi:polyribonucleotide nucleotidyltransferase